MEHDDPQDNYDQGTEIQLLARILPRLRSTVVVDVGAERGSFVRALLKAGAEGVFAFEPYPPSVAALRTEFAGVPAVKVSDLALGERDEDTRLYVVEDKSGRHSDAYHSLVQFDETPALRIVGELPVQCRTLDALVAEGTLPAHVGILKVDTERNDLAIVRQMGRLSSEIVMLEFWDSLPQTVGPAAYRVAEAADFLASRGYDNFVVVKRHDQFETLVLNDARTRQGDWGNLIFIHTSVFPLVAPVIHAAIAEAQICLIDRALQFAHEAQRRLQLTEEVSAEAERLREAAAERLRLIDELSAQLQRRPVPADHMSASFQQVERRIADLTATAREQRDVIERLSFEIVRLRAALETISPEAGKRVGGSLFSSLTSEP